jgi:hypothetical protein
MFPKGLEGAAAASAVDSEVLSGAGATDAVLVLFQERKELIVLLGLTL